MRGKLGSDLADEVLGRASVDGHASERAHKSPNRPFEQAVLPDEPDLSPQCGDSAEENEEIPVGGMGRAHDHKFRIGREFARGLPSLPIIPSDQQAPNDALQEIESLDPDPPNEGPSR